MKQLAIITLMLLSTTAIAENRYEAIAAKLNGQLFGSDYKLKVSYRTYLASASILGADIGFTEYRYCEISYNPYRLDNFGNDAVAWIFGHELAHCVNKDKGVFVLAEESRTREYRADRDGLELMTKAGYSFGKVLTDEYFLSYFDVPTEDSHPTWSDRVKSMGF
jgi:hypothetical protein